MFAIYDTFNNRIISRHRKLIRVVHAAFQLSASMPNGSYLPVTLKCIDEHGDIQNPDDDAMDSYCAMVDAFRHAPLNQIK